jgi:hypothetical protein
MASAAASASAAAVGAAAAAAAVVRAISPDVPKLLAAVALGCLMPFRRLVAASFASVGSRSLLGLRFSAIQKVTVEHCTLV